MKQKGEELLVLDKRVFILILVAIAFVGIVIGYTIGYITTPVKEIQIERANESEKTVLPSSVESAFAKKQEDSSQQSSTPVKKEENLSEKPVKDEQSEEKVNKSQIEIVKKEETNPNQNLQKHQGTKIKKHKTVQKSRRLENISTESFYTIQVGAFSDISNKEILEDRLNKAGYKAYFVKEDLYKIRVGKFNNYSQSKKVSEELKSKGFENFILKIRGTSKGGKK